jgi:hypothetical protein
MLRVVAYRRSQEMHDHPGRTGTVLAALALLACSDAVDGVISKTPVISTAVIPVRLQPPGTTVTYGVSSISSVFIDGVIPGGWTDQAGPGSTMVVSTDAIGNLSRIQFRITTPSATFTKSYSAADMAAYDKLTLSHLTAVLDAKSAPGGIAITSEPDFRCSATDLWGDE